MRMERLHTLPLVGVALCVASMACSRGEKTEVVHRDTDANEVPTMMTRDVVTIISDSGVARYRITAPIWLVYDEAAVPVWRFPEGMLLEKFDSVFGTDATVTADSATYFKNMQLWRLDGNVNILNTQGEKFLTQQLFWNQRDNKIYSDSFIHIERADRIIEGLGFQSNDRMTRYSITQPTGIFPTSQFAPRRGEASDSVSEGK